MRTRRSSRRREMPGRGFTLIEVLVTLGVIGLLAAILLPAVMAAREAARKTQCQNRLKQIGLALHGFQSARGAFPPALWDPDASAGYEPVPPHSQLLPHLDQGPLYRALDLNGPLYGGRAERRTVLPAFLCPSDPAAGGGTNYRACTGAGPYLFRPDGRDGSPEPAAAAGAFILWNGLPPAAVRDGLSNTAGFCEKRRSGPDTAWDPDTDYWYTGLGVGRSNPTADELLDFCGTYTGTPAVYFPDAGGRWDEAEFHHTLYNHAAGPNPPFPDCAEDSYQRHTNVGGLHAADSYHPGGVHLLMLDGSVRFTADTVDLALWRASATRSGGEAGGP